MCENNTASKSELQQQSHTLARFKEFKIPILTRVLQRNTEHPNNSGLRCKPI